MVLTAVTVTAGPGVALEPDREQFLALARTGWSYQLRDTMVGRDMSIPVHIHGRDLAGSAICVVGERPTAQSLRVLTSFRALARHVFGRPLPMRYAGPDASLCGPRRTVILRLYSGFPPNRALTRDLNWLNEAYELGLPQGRRYAATSPGMAQTFFGRRGAATHILVQQGDGGPGTLEETYFRSILIEELFQSFTFGMDILTLRRKPEFLSKLQEVPLNIHRLPWGSPPFMAALVSSNPSGLCAFDLFMMHAVANTPVDQTTDPAFLDYIDREFDALWAISRETAVNPVFAEVLDPECRPRSP